MHSSALTSRPAPSARLDLTAQRIGYMSLALLARANALVISGQSSPLWKSIPVTPPAGIIWVLNGLRTIMTRSPLSNVDWWNTVSDEAGPFEALVAIVSSRRLRQIFDKLPQEFAIAFKLHDI